MMMRSITALLLFSFLLIVTGGKHSLLYLYTMQSKTSNIYDCTAVTLLNDRQIDFYNSSSDKPRTAKQNWLNNIPESDWNTSTEKLQYDRQLLNRLIDIQMDESGHSQSGVHVLQWRHGCEGEQSSDGSLTVLNSINEFGYDGEDLIQFNCTSKTWITPEEEKNREREEEKNREREEEKNREREEEKNREREEEKNREREEKWSRIFNAVRKCDQCLEILKMYLKYKTTDITQSHSEYLDAFYYYSFITITLLFKEESDLDSFFFFFLLLLLLK
ncbi:histone-lysine N-methyltransferase, H3 lysine-79 specific-like [Astyanax mexicanus]|uniref:histone-lysine N-methyltransferase, H3 lysine-79 specific-like n=1 Tax=Astyanax mexicanus TaxID=7994 RepID=UPI0020CA9E1B|nr:histone-lysine N-methyltransferase, H3 lysine-79 specific-like [Astyanax mexicanus]